MLDSTRKRATLIVRSLRPEEMTPQLVSTWADLETRSVHANPYLSPYFVLPALRHLDPHKDILITLAEDATTGELHGIGIFEPRPPSLRHPFPHFRTYRSVHSFLSGILVDASCPRHVVAEMIARTPSQCIVSQLTPDHGPERFQEGSPFSHDPVSWYTLGSVERAVLRPASAGLPYLQTFLKSRHADCRRLHRQLLKLGTVRWRYLSGQDVKRETLQRFLTLEHSGWRGDTRSSLASSINQTRFFLDMIEGFQRHSRVFFTELLLNDTVIASTCNLISCNTGFAFKIGWDVAFARYSPGILNEVEFIRHAPTVCSHLDYIDSGASPGSFIEKLWLDRRRLMSGCYASTAWGKLTLSLIMAARRTVYPWFDGDDLTRTIAPNRSDMHGVGRTQSQH